MSTHPSIFNDVLGPVMRGPSSSHTAASWRIAKVAMDLLDDDLAEALVEFDADGAWAPNYEEQGTVLGMSGGLLGIDITDARIIEYEQIADEQQIVIRYAVSRFPTDHANTVRLGLGGRSGKKLSMTAVSLGGGMFEVRILNGHRINIQGDYHELIAYSLEQVNGKHQAHLQSVVPDSCSVHWSHNGQGSLFELKSSRPFSEELLSNLNQLGWVKALSSAVPVMPIISGRAQAFPFTSYPTMLAYNEHRHLSLGELGRLYEQKRSGLAREEVEAKMLNLIQLIEGSIATGLAGTHYEDRILDQQSHLIAEAETRGKIHQGSEVNRIIENIAAIMESKSGMEVVVAAPTAGGCGALGGTIKAYADHRQIPSERKLKAYFAAGMVGVFFARGPGFSAEEGGCQLECGAAAAMTAAALVDLSGGSARQALNAASMALQNMIGLVCDPVADRVEVPCLGKNISAGMNALTASIMSLAGFDHVIPLDQVIQTVERVASTMPTSLCCTGKGGLAITDKSQELKSMLAQRKRRCGSC